MSSAAIFQIQSIIIYALMVFGVWKRRKRKVHVPVMTGVIILDVILILQIELTRGAVEKASKAMVNPTLLNIHVTFALLSVILYVLLVFTGRKVLAGEKTMRPPHKLFGWAAFVMRSLTLLTSFFAVS